jgi:signal transduction histidine kinase
MNSDKSNNDRRRISKYAIAVGAVALGTLLRYGMNVWVGPLPTYITFYPAVMLAALLGGFWPGIVATILVDIVTDYWLLPPGGFGIASFPDAVGLGLFSLMGVFMSSVAERYNRTGNKLRESEKRLKFLSAELIRAQEKERKKIASELHDNIASSLSVAILGLGRASKELQEGTQGHELITKAIAMIKNSAIEARRMMNLLRPSMLDDLGLLPSITWFLDQYSAMHSGLAINKDIAVKDAEIPDSIKIDVYRIIQEAFTNIAKHSNASVAELSLKKKEGLIELTIADNGQGFNPDTATAAKRSTSGIGLISMKERAELAGGTMIIQSIAGKGTTVRVCWSAGA